MTWTATLTKQQLKMLNDIIRDTNEETRYEIEAGGGF